MRNARPLFGIIFISAFLLFGFGIPKKIEKKVQKELENTFQLKGCSLNPINVSASINAELPQKINTDNFFKISKANEHLGYMFVDKALAKTAYFDYLVIFDTDLKVVHSKILVYREEYGGEIGSKRWLKQFLGKTGGDRVDHESNIDGIAGATISVRSMTNAMDDLLQTIALLHKNNVL